MDWARLLTLAYVCDNLFGRNIRVKTANLFWIKSVWNRAWQLNAACTLKTLCRLLFCAVNSKRQPLQAAFFKGRRYYAAWIFEACLPLGPVVTSKETFWPSFKVLKPSMLIAEKCANKSSPPSSGVIKPKPLASLNHLTIPVAIECYFLKDTNEKTAKGIQLTRKYSAWWLPVFRWLLFYLF